jgi:serine/threonine protein kinase/hemoglobin-like flavoprotein/class 3 adenylate cyclase
MTLQKLTGPGVAGGGAQLEVPLHQITPGFVIGEEFQITDVLAHGGMGVIYRAIQRTTGAERAIKLMHPSLVCSPSNRKRFLQEARVSSLIRSDHVAKVVAAGIDNKTGMPWLAMELLDGVDLGTRLAEVDSMPLAEVAAIAVQIGHALGAAHEQGIIHRDLKPDNVFLAASQLVGMPFVVKLLDFGVAKLTQESNRITMGVGTPAYMAPEQTESNASVSPATDIWSLGLLVFRALVGKSFWLAANEESIAALWREVLIDPIPPASVRAAEYGLALRVPRDFDEWFARCVVRNPEARFQSVHAATAALAQLVSPRTLTPGSGVRAVLDIHRSQQTGELKRPEIKLIYQASRERVVADAKPGMSVLEASRYNNLAHTSVCGGRARCTTCRVLVLEGAENLAPRTAAEQAVAQRKRWPKNIRLACQARVMGPVTVRRLVMEDDNPSLVAPRAPKQISVHPALVSVLYMKTVGLHEFADSALAYDVAYVIQRLIETVSDPIEQNGGKIERCTGADLLATFPQKAPQSAIAALRAALRMQSRVEVFNQYLIKHFDLSLRLRVGLHHGDVMVGNVGHAALAGDQIFGSGVADAEAAAHAAVMSEIRILATDAFCAGVGERITLGRHIEPELGSRSGRLVQVVDFRTPDQVYLVQSTFERVASRADEFATIFYDRMFEIYPDVKALFTGVDMRVQRHMLMQSIDSVVRAMHDIDAIREPLHNLGRRHVAYGVKLMHYKYVGEALLWALEQFFGTDLVPELYVAWMETYGQIARLMIEGSMEEGSMEESEPSL